MTPLEETARGLDDLQRQGKVRYVGVSNFYAWQAEKLVSIQRQFGFAPIVANQVYYSLLGRDIECEIVPQAKQAGIGIMAWGPLAGGFLTGRYSREQPDGDGRRKTFDFPPVDLEAGYSVVEKLKEIAKAHDASPAQVALAWVLASDIIDTVIIGASKMTQLESNLKAAEIRLSPQEVAALSKLSMPTMPYPYWIQWGEQGTLKALAEGWKPK
jgi:aryl-alcohol dehydrogenase-like predicted oxidoreductase